MPVKQHQVGKSVRQTLLVVGEGDSEEAFLKYLRELYCCDGKGVSVTVRNAHGKGPDHVIDHTIRQSRMYSYNVCAAFLDTDISWTAKLEKRAHQNKISMVGSIPCFEGLLLAILGERVPERSVDCKRAIQRLFAIDLSNRYSYASYFPLPVLQAARNRLVELNKLLMLFQGP